MLDHHGQIQALLETPVPIACMANLIWSLQVSTEAAILTIMSSLTPMVSLKYSHWVTQDAVTDLVKVAKYLIRDTVHV